MASTRIISAVRYGIPGVLPKRVARAVSESTRESRLYFRELRGRHVVHLMHIRKTGGTAIKFALEPHLEAAAHLLKFGTHETTLPRIPQGDKVAFFLRDPISRFVSGFNSRLREGRPRFYTPWTRQEADAFCRFPSPNDLAESFDSRDKDTRSAGLRAMYSIEHINLSYWYWFGSPEIFDSRWKDIFFIGFQERLEEDFRRFCRLLKLPDTVELPSSDFAAHRSPPDMDTKLSPRAVKNLKYWYARDYDLYRRCAELAREMYH